MQLAKRPQASTRVMLMYAVVSSLVPLYLTSCSKGQGKQFDSAQPAAEVLGRQISWLDIAPLAEEFEGDVARDGAQDINEMRRRASRLREIVLTVALDDFAARNNIEVSEPEVDELSARLNQSAGEESNSNEFTRIIQRSVDYETVRNWKISRTLYEKYGGVVVFQQGNPLEPVGAIKSLLRSLEDKGDLRINDISLKREFWRTLEVVHGPFVVAEDEVDYSEPWWSRTTD